MTAMKTDLTPEARAELRRLDGRAAEGPWFVRARPTDDGLSVIEDGRDHGLFPITGEAFEIELTVAMRNALPALLDIADDRDALTAEAEWLAKENFELAANACEDGYAGEHGHHRCRLVDAERATSARLRAALERLVDKQSSIEADVKSGHTARGAAASDWMREDDREFRRDLTALFDEARAALQDAAPQPATEGEK